MRGGAFASLKWVKPKGKLEPLTADQTVLASTQVGRALRAAINEFGLPEPRAKEDKKTPEAEAAELLRAAAEIEHALLVEYLYAAYSVAPDGPAQSLGETIARDRSSIAVEEMGHMITVQNLLLALGEDPYVDRENVPLNGKPAGQYPFAITFEPLSGDSLAKYVTTESLDPAFIDDTSLKQKLVAIAKRADKAAGGTVNHVGVLYAKLFWLFQPNDAPHPLWPQLPVELLPPGRHIDQDVFGKLAKAKKGPADPRQVTASEFGRTAVDLSNPTADDVYVIEIRSRADALFALSAIAAQGESPKPDSNSHFTKFLDAYEKYETTFPPDAIRKGVPRNPNTADKVQTNGDAEAARITHPKAIRWAKLFNLRYQLLLLELWLGVNTQPSVTGPLGRKSLFKSAIGEMQSRVKRIADELLPTIPLKNGGDPIAAPAAAPFELPLKALPTTENDVKRRMVELLDKSEALAVELENLPDQNKPTTDENRIIAALRKADQPLRAVLTNK